MRGKPRLLVGAAAFALLAAGCSTAVPPSATSPTSAAVGAGTTLCPNKGAALTDKLVRPKVASSGNVTAAVEEQVHDYNNQTATANNFANSLLSLAQPSAFDVDSNYSVCVDGDVMDSVEQTATSPLTIVYKIKSDAVWSDGQPVSCHDFYLSWLQGASKAVGKAGPAFDPATTAGYDQMKAPVCSDNDKTVTTTYNTPFGDYKSLFSYMMPAHIIEKATSSASDVTKLSAADTGADVKAFAANYIKLFSGFSASADVSAGPYMLSSLSDEQAVLKRNPKWWGSTAGPESLTLRTNTDGQSEVQSLQNQEVQVISPQPDAGLATQLKALPNTTFSATAGATYEHIDFNMKDPLFQGTTGAALRQAMFYCVDRTDIITKLVAGVNPATKPLGSLMFLPKEQAYVDHYSQYAKADTAKAKAAMEAGGWKLGSDGVYANGSTKASFRLGHKVVDNRERISQLVQASCAKAGIKIADDQDAQFNAKRLSAHDFDTALFAWVGVPFKTGSLPLYTTNAGANYNFYSDTKVDALFKQAATITDQTKANDLYNQIDALMAKDEASIPLYQFSDMIAQSTTLSPKLTYDGVAGGPFWNVYEWKLQG